MKTFQTYFIILFLSIGTKKFHAQNWIAVQDTNFAKYLCTTYPLIANNNCTLFDKDKLVKLIFISGTMDFNSLKIERIPEIVHFRSPDTLLGFGNNIKENFTINLHRLKYANFNNSKLSFFPKFYTDIYRAPFSLSLNRNSITSIPSLDTIKQYLTFLEIRNNSLTELADMKSLDSLKYLDIRNNYLTFEDLIPLMNTPISKHNLIIFPQKQIPLPDTLFAELSKPTVYQLPFEQDLNSNTYSWYKNDVLYKTTKVNELSFDFISSADSGRYYVVMNNSNYPNQTIRTESFYLKIENTSKFNPSDLGLETMANCNNFSINLKNLSDYPDYQFSIIGETQTSYALNSSQLSELPFGKFELEIKDALGVTTKYKEWLTQGMNENCDLVLTPNGDGNQDSIYLEGSGILKIFDVNGKEISSFNLPGFWNGNDSTGNLLSTGYYILQYMNDKTVGLTILR